MYFTRFFSKNAVLQQNNPVILDLFNLISVVCGSYVKSYGDFIALLF